MAEQIPYSVASSVSKTLSSLAFKEIASIYGVEAKIDQLKKIVGDIKVNLSGADRRKPHMSVFIHKWISDVKRVIYKVDDLLDELYTQHMLHKRDAEGKVRQSFSSSNPIVFRLKVARKVRNITIQKLNAAYEIMSKLHSYDPSIPFKIEFENSNRRKTSSSVGPKDIVGREGNKKDIIDLLLNHNNDSDQNNVSLVAIVGVGGLGKTALAQLVYNDAEVKRFFDKRMWVCVAQDFDVKAIANKILYQANDQELTFPQNKLQEELNGKIYLLVLDDVWNEDSEKWSELKKCLVCGAKGSKILLTTRNQVVANIMGVKTSYVLNGLTNEQSWTLMEALLEDTIINPTLQSIGQKIVAKCVGVPLVIREMAHELKMATQESSWEDFSRDLDHFWQRVFNRCIMPILELSYDNLPIGLQQCFMYCSLYPQDWTYKKDELIDLWMAQGFLEDQDQDQDKNLCQEDIGQDYIKALSDKSFLDDVERDELGEIKYFKMHPLMHGVSLRFKYNPYERRRNDFWHVYASFEEYNDNLYVGELPRFRTFIEIKKIYHSDLFNSSVFKCLRCLDLSYHKMRDFPASISNMSHLRYLNLSCCYELIHLPKSISKLFNLQTLSLNWCSTLIIPKDVITKLINLRRLDVEGCKAFEDGMPIGLGRMTSLQNLSCFILRKEKNMAKLNELKELDLRGGLTIQYLGSITDVEEESKDVNLRTKEKLVSLTLRWGLNLEMKNHDPMKLLENLCPHQNLKALTIEDYPGERLSNWLLSCTNLVTLKFLNIRNCQYMVALEGLISLKTLHIQSMDKLEYIDYKESSSSTNFFASLEELKISRCKSLKRWQMEKNAENHPLPPFSRLSSLQINRCPNLSRVPTFSNLLRHLELACSSTELLNVSTVGPSTSNHVAASLSMLESLHIEGIDLESLPEEWMQNLSSLKHLSVASFSSPEKLFHHMQSLSAELEKFTIRYLHSWSGEDYNIQYEKLQCLHSLQAIVFSSCDHLMALPEWICGIRSLGFISIQFCENLESFPEGMCHLRNLQTLLLDGASPLLKKRCDRETGADWEKIRHIPNIWIDLQQI